MRRKGHQFERDVANALRHIFPDARRQLEYQASEANGVDIKNTAPFKIQCKCLKQQPNIPAVMKEISHDEDEIPVVAFKVTRKGTYAAMRFSDWEKLISRLYDQRRTK